MAAAWLPTHPELHCHSHLVCMCTNTIIALKRSSHYNDIWFVGKHVSINSILFDHNKHFHRNFNSPFKSFDWHLARLSVDSGSGSCSW